MEFFQLHHPLNVTVLCDRKGCEQVAPTTWKWTITVKNTGSALRTPTARRILRGCQRGNQVLIFLSEADLPLEPLALPLHTATCRLRWQEHANESAPDSI